MYAISCADRILAESNPIQIDHAEAQIINRIIKQLINKSSMIKLANAGFLQFRIVTVERHNLELRKEIRYYSSVVALPKIFLPKNSSS